MPATTTEKSALCRQVAWRLRPRGDSSPVKARREELDRAPCDLTPVGRPCGPPPGCTARVVACGVENATGDNYQYDTRSSDLRESTRCTGDGWWRFYCVAAWPHLQLSPFPFLSGTFASRLRGVGTAGNRGVPSLHWGHRQTTRSVPS